MRSVRTWAVVLLVALLAVGLIWLEGVAGPGDTSVRSAGRRAAGAGGLAGSGFNPPADAGRAPGGRLSAWESLPAAGGEAAGAKALSRAFQKDARRYDGGFRLYD